MKIQKKDFIKTFMKNMDSIDDDAWIDVCLNQDEYGYLIHEVDDKTYRAMEVYKYIIEAIADGEWQNWQEIAEAISIENLDYIYLIGVVKNVIPEIHNNKVYYRISPEDLKEDMYSGLFEPSATDTPGYYVHQTCEYEDSYHGQMLINVGYAGWLVVEYSC